MNVKLASMAALASVVTLGLATSDAAAVGDVVTIDISGFSSWDGVGDPDNEILLVDMAAALGLTSGSTVTMNGIGWDVELSTFGGSWGRESRMYFDDNVNPDGTGLFLAPGISDAAPVTNVRYQSDFDGDPLNDPDVAKLADLGIGDIVLPDGMLRIEFYESFDDTADTIDGTWQANSFLLVQATPAPGALALLGLAGVAGTRRRRG